MHIKLIAEQPPSHIKVTIKAEGPLLFSERKPGGIFQQSLPYVPGSVLRGALAALELGGQKHELPHEGEDCQFCQLFLNDGAAVFTNAYPVRDSTDEVQVLPATAVSCKNNSGFLPPMSVSGKKDKDSPHGVFDTLIERFCWEMLQPSAFVYSPNCPVCRGRVEAYKGFYVRHNHGDYGAHYHKRDVDQRLLTRVAINRRRMVAEDGLLYSPFVISQTIELDKRERDKKAGENEEPTHTQTRFVGHVWGLPQDYTDKLKTIATLGGSSSRGLGHVTIEAEIVPENGQHWQTIRERVEVLDAEIGEVWKLFRKSGGRDIAKEGIYFTIGLWADAVLHTRDGLPTMVFDAEMLKDATGIAATLVRSYASYGYSGGWQSAWGLPKPAEVLARCGSVYVFRAEELTEADYRALAALEIAGIGARTTEGYGQVRVSDAFHLKRRELNEQPER